jgi:hypothetical protein
MQSVQLRVLLQSRIRSTAPSRREPFYYKFAKHNYQILIVTRYYVELCGVKKGAESRLETIPKLDSAPFIIPKTKKEVTLDREA